MTAEARSRRTRLLEGLASYRAENAREEEALSRVLAFLSRPDPFRRSEPEHVTASAVVGRPENVAGTGPAGLHPPQQLEFLLVFHRKLGRWLQPGGHVEPGDDSVFATALREVREETGLDRLEAPFGESILDLDVHPIPAFGDEPAHLHYDVRFLLTSADGGAPVSNGAAWFSSAEGPSADMDGSLARAVAKARRLLVGSALE